MAARMLSPAAEQAIAATRPTIDKKNDPRNPVRRLETFFDHGTLELITAEDASGVLCGGQGTRNTGGGICLGRHHSGRRDGRAGLQGNPRGL